MGFSEQITTPNLALGLATRNRAITSFIKQLENSNPDLAAAITKAKTEAEQAAQTSGKGGLDIMLEGHNAVIAQFPELRAALGLDE